MSDEASHDPSIPSWLLAPQPTGVRLQLNVVAEATRLTPDALAALQKALEQLQKVPIAVADKPQCPKLTNCGTNSGDCPQLVNCGTYSPTPPPPCPDKLMQPAPK